MRFFYKGKTREGKTSEGIIEAETRILAVAQLRNNEIIPLSVERKRAFSSTDIFPSPIKITDKIIFAKNLSGMLSAGLSISRALQVLAKQTQKESFKKVINDLIDTINKGGNLSEGMNKYPKVFSNLFVAMVKAGEESGGLPGALAEVASNLDKSYELTRKVKGALIYPGIILGAIFVIAILMFIFVVPTLTKTFKDLGATLPLSTQLIIWFSDFLTGHIFVVIGIIIFGVIGISFALKIQRVQNFLDYVTLRIPSIGLMIKELNTARATRTLSLLLASGVSINRAITITGDVIQNVYYKRSLIKVQNAIEKGEPISTVFINESNLYPVMVGEMIAVGEETGKLEKMLLDVAVFYEGEVQTKTNNLSTIVEPVLMIFIGIAVGFFAVSMLSPMYTVMDNIK